MNDLTQDIIIRVKAEKDDLVSLQEEVEKTKKSFKGWKNVGIDKDLKALIKNAEKPLEEIRKQFDIAGKNVDRFRNKLREATVKGIDADKVKDQLTEAENRYKAVIKTSMSFMRQYNKRLSEQLTPKPIIKTANGRLNLGDSSAFSGIGALNIPTQIESKWNKIRKSISDAGNALKRFSQFSSSVVKSTKHSATWLEKLWGRIRNISVYRMIRTGIKWITTGFREGLQNFAQYNGEVNKTVSELNGNLKQIRNTMGVSLAYTLQSLQPIIERVLSGITEGLNAFNLALAKIQGKNQFSKAKKNVDDYAKSLEKAKKLSFDVFEVLNSGDSATSPQNMFEEANIEDNESKLSRFFERIFGFIKNVSDAIGRIIDRLAKTDIFDKLLYIGERLANSIADIIISLLDSGAIDTILDVITDIWDIVSLLIGGITKIISGLNQIGLLKPLLLGIALAWGAIKVAALGAFVAQLFAINPLLGAIAGGVMVGGVTSLIVRAVSDSRVNGYANGGIPEKSELFYMNENGVPEALVNTGGSQTNVINIDQLSEGMRRGFVQAIYETGLIDAVQTRVVIDGNSVNDNAFARAIFPALKTESRRRGGNQL